MEVSVRTTWKDILSAGTCDIFWLSIYFCINMIIWYPRRVKLDKHRFPNENCKGDCAVHGWVYASNGKRWQALWSKIFALWSNRFSLTSATHHHVLEQIEITCERKKRNLAIATTSVRKMTIEHSQTVGQDQMKTARGYLQWLLLTVHTLHVHMLHYKTSKRWPHSCWWRLRRIDFTPLFENCCGRLTAFVYIYTVCISRFSTLMKMVVTVHRMRFTFTYACWNLLDLIPNAFMSV